MAKSVTEIVNFAAGHLGAQRIQDISDTSEKVARYGSLFYEQARDETLRRARWSFAMGSTTPARLLQPLEAWNYHHALPTDFIRLSHINGVDVWDVGKVDWFDLEGPIFNPDGTPATGRRILSNYENIRIKFVRRITDTTLFDPLFTSALSVLLASKMARGVTGSSRTGRRLLEEYHEIELPDAQQVNGAEVRGNENPPLLEAISRSYLVRSRGIASSQVLDLVPDDPAGFRIPGVDV